jgi:hypothetical protein
MYVDVSLQADSQTKEFYQMSKTIHRFIFIFPAEKTLFYALNST